MKRFACEAFKKEMRLRVDFNNMMSGFVKGGITPEELEANAAAYEAAAKGMDEKARKHEVERAALQPGRSS